MILSDQSRDNMGNLFVWPGSHREIAEYDGVRAVVGSAGALDGYPSD